MADISIPPFRSMTAACSSADKPLASLTINEDGSGGSAGWADKVEGNSKPSVNIAATIASRRARVHVAELAMADPERSACALLTSYISCGSLICFAWFGPRRPLPPSDLQLASISPADMQRPQHREITA